MPECSHHWVIDTPNGGPFSQGTCKKCKARRDNFRNSVEDLPRYRAGWLRLSERPKEVQGDPKYYREAGA